MNAKSLMIGDWVKNPDGELCKVCMIDGRFSDYVSTDNYAHDDGTLYDYAVKELNPIPITAEILDKNFIQDKLKSGEPQWVNYTDYVELHISEYTDGLYEILVDEVEMSGLPTWLMYVSGVHQLQHALRLVGIEKEIVVS